MSKPPMFMTLRLPINEKNIKLWIPLVVFFPFIYLLLFFLSLFLAIWVFSKSKEDKLNRSTKIFMFPFSAFHHLRGLHLEITNRRENILMTIN